MPKLTEAERLARAERQRRHPVFRTRRVAGMAITSFSHWSDEEPRSIPSEDIFSPNNNHHLTSPPKHLYQQLEDGTWVRKRGAGL